MKVDKKLFKKLFKKFFIILILLAGGTSILLGSVFAKVIPNNYSAKSQILISENEKEKNNDLLPFDLKYIGTYSVFMYTDEFLEEVHSNFSKKNKYNLDEIKDRLLVLTSEDSQIITIQVITNDKKDSVELSNLIAKTAIKKIPNHLNKYQLTMISKAKKVETQKKISRKGLYGLVFLISFLVYLMISCYVFLFSKKLYFKKQIVFVLNENNIYKL
ncbi:Wzz/FepE/Etk N-terminal domain-containing protein [Enterococcus lactis]|uniref:Wzz/FepE/Etk N-terminal domain-containing protein n=1 Tax=Enterococcus lactis TaxID=357441 RepID=UPI0040418AB5